MAKGRICLFSCKLLSTALCCSLIINYFDLHVSELLFSFKFLNACIVKTSSLICKQKAWEVAQAPFKNLLMMGFMMWMAGNTVHLFSIGITFSALWQPIGALQGVGKGKLAGVLFFTALFHVSLFCFLFLFVWNYNLGKGGDNPHCLPSSFSCIHGSSAKPLWV